tara:strand:- start:187 stop:360 length:174 start_codon:yes stop_codon:yes gene_type:complete
MIIGLMDIFYVSMIVIIFGFIIHLESQIHAIKTLIQCSLDRSNGQSIKSIAKKKYKE